MAPYLIIIIVAFFLTSLDFVRLNAREKLYFYIPFIFILILFAGLRPAGIDRDYAAYKNLYGYMEYFQWSEAFKAYSMYQMEPGYVLLNKFFFSLGFTYGQFLFIYELIIGIFLWKFIYKYSPFPFISVSMYVCLFYYFREFTQIRFAFSSTLVMSGLMNLGEEHHKKGYAYLILAGLIHNSAWVGLLIPLCYKFFYNRWIYLIFPPLGFLIGLFNPIGIILSLVGLPPQLARYLNTDMEMGSAFMSYLFMYTFLLISAFKYEKLKAMFGKKFEFIYVSASMSVFIGVMFLTFPIMQRLSGALFTISIIWIPYLMKMFYAERSFAWHDILGAVVVVLFIFYGLKLVLVSNLLHPYF